MRKGSDLISNNKAADRKKRHGGQQRDRQRLATAVRPQPHPHRQSSDWDCAAERCNIRRRFRIRRLSAHAYDEQVATATIPTSLSIRPQDARPTPISNGADRTVRSLSQDLRLQPSLRASLRRAFRESTKRKPSAGEGFAWMPYSFLRNRKA